MAYLEDFSGSIEDTIDCKDGKYTFLGAPIPTIDSERLGRVTLKKLLPNHQIFGFGRLITKYYYNNPEKFSKQSI